MIHIDKTRTMSPQSVNFVFYVLLSFVTLGQGMKLFMDTTPDGVYCGHLYCWTDKTVTNNNIQTVFGIAVYDVNKYSMSVKIASLSVFGPDICLRESEVTSINATGNVSKYHAELILAFTETSYCVNGSFVCELEFSNMNGDPDAIRETVSSRSSGNCYEIVKELVGNDNENLETERELVELRKQNAVLKTEVSRLQEIVNISRDITQGVCFKGAQHNNSREEFLLWGKVPALCDTETDGGGWIVIQRRTKGDVDFYRSWKDYKNGFGTPDTDFWIGNDIIHNLTTQGWSELRIDMKYAGNAYFAHYSYFHVANEVVKYRMSVYGNSGTAGKDCFIPHDGRLFSTYDRDNDGSDGSCATKYQGAWWYIYSSCYESNLNGVWGKNAYEGNVWEGLAPSKSLPFSEMKIRLV